MKEVKKGTYAANVDMPILYNYQNGGGVNGRTIKAGETITVIGSMTDFDTVSICTIETLRRIDKQYFMSNFTAIPITIKY